MSTESPSSALGAIVIGGDSLLGRAYRAYWQQRGQSVPWTSRRQPLATGACHFDLASMAAAELPWQHWVRAGYRDVFIPAALTGLLRCEREPALSYRLNLQAPLNLAQEVLKYGLRPILCSSDAVFDGQTGGYREDSPVGPLHVYGQHKATLESEAQNLDGALILRLTKIYTLQPEVPSLLVDMAHSLRQQRRVPAAWDQVFNPIYLGDIPPLLSCLEGVTGLVNVGGPEIWSRYELACQLAQALGVSSARIEKIALHELDDGLQRPLRTHLEIHQLQSKLSFSLFSLSSAIRELSHILSSEP